ncbi:hypothetical protein TNCV_2540441 [Trichonephila clavipes]|nr:hypothetical protein TNCV_2540441 [Trichonephila clavipes]
MKQINVHDSQSQKPKHKPARSMAAFRLNELNDCLWSEKSHNHLFKKPHVARDSRFADPWAQ